MDELTKEILAQYWETGKLPARWKAVKVRNSIPGTYHCKVVVSGETWNNHISLSRYKKTDEIQVIAGACSYTKILIIGPEIKVEAKKDLTDAEIKQLSYRQR